eukprot:m.286231 g.286231  ORF g.286231 m.286231 type:complete len:202 (+) comp16349_c0_seq8:1412-2017(+)
MAKLGEEQVLQDVFLIDGGKGSADLDSEVGRSAGGQRLLRHFRTSANYAISASGPGNKKRFYTLDVHAKRFCLLRSPLTNLARRVDILVIPRWQFGFAILSWTGSVMFNRELRLHCKKELGCSLTAHGLVPYTNHNKRCLQFFERTAEPKITGKTLIREPASNENDDPPCALDFIRADTEEQAFEIMELEFVPPNDVILEQ